ncbi:hypothetical protein FACS189437_06450 [Bacteroidia bacterium]|nr:hypothetical protein FACS189437_06450 [Bacteroidia bacterium]
MILDEAQKIKNYETKTASAVNRLKYKHVLVITGYYDLNPLNEKLSHILIRRKKAPLRRKAHRPDKLKNKRK